MSLIPKKLWDLEFPGKDMPKDCTYEQFSQATKYADGELYRGWDLEEINALTELKQNTRSQKVRDYCTKRIEKIIGGLDEF